MIFFIFQENHPTNDFQLWFYNPSMILNWCHLSEKYWNDMKYGLTKDGWLRLWNSLPDNTQEYRNTPCYMIMLLWGVFWDEAFN